MSQPTDITEMGLELYEAVSPLAKTDEAEGWALLRYVDALIGQAQPVSDQARDRTATELGWSIMMDVNNCPAYALPWLSQFAGVDLTRLRQTINVLLRNELHNPSFEYDAVGVEPATYSLNNGAGTTASTLTVSEAWAAIGKKALLYKGTKDNTVTERGLGWILHTTSANYIPIAHGEFLSLQLKYNAIKAPDKGFQLRVEWFKADAATLISSSNVSHINEGAAGIHTVTHLNFEPPEHAAFARVTFVGLSIVALKEIEFYTDELMAIVSSVAWSGSIEYIDGDQPGCTWVGTPGNSDSIKTAPQTEEEFNELKRARIKELPSTRRGTPGAIVKAVQQYLIGDKTVIMQERPGGNPWRLVIVTFIEETLSEQLVREAIEEQLPAGIVLEYSVVPAVDWLIIRTEYLTWQAVKEAFVTWGGVRLNQPGT